MGAKDAEGSCEFLRSLTKAAQGLEDEGPCETDPSCRYLRVRSTPAPQLAVYGTSDNFVVPAAASQYPVLLGRGAWKRVYKGEWRAAAAAAHATALLHGFGTLAPLTHMLEIHRMLHNTHSL